jgi:hypothetical protein
MKGQTVNMKATSTWTWSEKLIGFTVVIELFVIIPAALILNALFPSMGGIAESLVAWSIALLFFIGLPGAVIIYLLQFRHASYRQGVIAPLVFWRTSEGKVLAKGLGYIILFMLAAAAIIGVFIAGATIMSFLIDRMGLIPALICAAIGLLCIIHNKLTAIHSAQQELLRQRPPRHEDSDDHEALRFS